LQYNEHHLALLQRLCESDLLTYLRVLILPQNIGSSVEALAANSKPFSALASVELRAWEHAL